MSENEKMKIEKSIKGRPQRSTTKKSTVKGRWIACVLYPDNCHQMEVLGYLENIGQTMLYITHQPEDDEKKEHIHVMIHFDYPRTSSGFCSAFGTGRFIKTGDLYEPVSDDVDCTGKPVVQLPILSHAEIVSSPADYFRYVLHQDFKSVKAGKKEYQVSDITFRGNENELRKLAYQEYQQFNNLINDLMYYSDCSENAHDLMQVLIDNKRYDLISYIQGHSYFIKEFFLHSEMKPKPKQISMLDIVMEKKEKEKKEKKGGNFHA